MTNWLQQRARQRRGTALSATTTEPDGRPRRIPAAAQPVFPVLSLAAFFATAQGAPAITDQGHVTEVSSGRRAIALALLRIGVEPGDRILVPAYHCTAMIEPIIAAGAAPAFYRTRANLDADLDHAATLVDGRTKAILAVHFFGFPQKLAKLRRFADHHKVTLIEDCAHAFWGSEDGRPLGSTGDYAIGSSRKFFPIADGGCLISREPPTAERLARPALTDNLRGGLAIVENSLCYGRLWALEPFIALLDLMRGQARPKAVAAAENQTKKNTLPLREEMGLSPQGSIPAMTAISRLLRRLVSPSYAAGRRRVNYEKLLVLLGDLPGVRPLFPVLPAGVVPFMLPLWVDNLDRIFPALEQAALPMQRYGQFLWAGVDADFCPVTDGFSRHLLQLPCHQTLTDTELTQIAGTFRQVVTEAANSSGGSISATGR